VDEEGPLVVGLHSDVENTVAVELALLLLATVATMTQACSISMKVTSLTEHKFKLSVFKPYNVLKKTFLLEKKGDEQGFETTADDCLGTYKLKFKGITSPDVYNYNRKFNRDGVLHIRVETDDKGVLLVHDDFIPSDFIEKK